MATRMGGKFDLRPRFAVAPEGPRSTGRPMRRYNWDAWSDGEAWHLRWGVDFTSLNGLRVSAHHAANARGLMVTVSACGDDAYVQFYEEGDR